MEEAAQKEAVSFLCLFFKWLCIVGNMVKYMMQSEENCKQCPVCGNLFSPYRPRQKYCSTACRRYANRHGGRAYDGTPIISDPSKPALRTFCCLKCHKEVRVTENEDLRTKFCSQRCENLYWKHSGRGKTRNIRRKFKCKNCGNVVVITEALDRRTVFCSHACYYQWFRKTRDMNYQSKLRKGWQEHGAAKEIWSTQ